MAYPPAVKETTAGITVMDESMRTMSRQSLSVQFGKLSDGQQRNSRLLLAVVFALVGVFAVVFVGGIFSIEFTKETTIKGNRLETVDGEPVEVRIAADSACPLVDLLEKSSAELANEKLVSFSTTDSDGAIWEHTIKIADVASEINLHIFTDPDSRKIRVASFGGGLLRLSKTARPSGYFFYEGNYMDPYDCVDGCAVSFCDGVNVDEEEDESSHGDVADADGNRLRRLHPNLATASPPAESDNAELKRMNELFRRALEADSLSYSYNDDGASASCDHLDVTNLNKFQPFQWYSDKVLPGGYHFGPGVYDTSKKEWSVIKKNGKVNSNTKIAGYGRYQDDWKNWPRTCTGWYSAIVEYVYKNKPCNSKGRYLKTMTDFKKDYEKAMEDKKAEANCLTRKDHNAFGMDNKKVDKIDLHAWCPYL